MSLKNVLLFLITILVSSCALKEDKLFETDLYYDNLKGAVKSLKENTFKIKEDSVLRVNKEVDFENKVSYNKKGYQVKREVFYRGLLHTEIGSNHNKFGKPELWQRTRVNREGDTIRTITKVEHKTGEIIESSFNAENRLNNLTTFYLDEKLEIIERTDKHFFTDSTGTFGKMIWDFDKLELLKIHPPVSEDTSLLRLNNDRQVIYSTAIKNGVEVSKNKTFEYRYDDNGNWIEKKVLLNGKPYQVVKRVYEYF